ncbi:MAG: hypothetical protein E5Y10_22875 [Mesorhizobium sp.]|uniref:hypothetical protein n=1 Tax=Mesorhizobium sp. TaxID=1871066 RepID=UPI0011F73983|nr:hypothetical protein [Mesorhizobium sp.]TIN41388.1 MAG: hypothetical protein E5Y13_05730 [Mesorhizobium sp.]TJU86166.1 MAG: hypothetical protein E5Y10_22875 [Mesorhizobium sp.]
MWAAEKIWPGETVFVLAAGPSTNALDLSRLRGRRVIAVKSAWKVFAAADVLFFADGRWWREKALRPGVDDFAGLIVTTAMEIGDPRVKKMKKVAPTALAEKSDTVALARSSTTGAINLAIHFGAKKIVLLGVDAKLAPDGTRHNHGLKWPWPKGATAEAFADQAREFATIAPSAVKLGVEIVNANPDSAIKTWLRLKFEECL